MSALFISDVHLSAARPAVTGAFFRFLLDRAVHADALYILGDLVETWLGDDDPDALTRTLISELRALSDSGTHVFVTRGNRDFLMGTRFARETGVRLLPVYHTVDTGRGRLLMCHGDTLCTDDRAYQRFRLLVQNPVSRWLLARLPLGQRQRLAADWRRRSQAANSNKAENIMDVNPDAVRRAMTRYGADTLIHGHTHRPGTHQHDCGRRVVLGDWGERGWYGELDKGELRLESFPIAPAAGA